MSKAATWTRIHLASLGILFVALVVFARDPWFFGDEWDYLTRRGLNDPAGLFLPHNEHWNTVPILMYRGLFAVFGVRTYWPYLLPVFALHLLVVHFLWRLMRNADIPLAFATAAALAFGVFGRGWENILWGVQVTYLGSLAGGLALLLVIDARGSPRRVAAVAVGAVLILPFSGISVVMVASVGLLALRRWDWRRAAIATGPAAAVYLAWLKWQGHVGLERLEHFHGGPGDIPRYVFGGVGAALSAPLKSVRVGEAIFVIVVVVTAMNLRRWWRTQPQLLALGMGAPLLFAVISQGRGEFPDPAQPRYVYLGAAMLLPLVAMVAWTLVRQRAAAVPVLTAVALLVAAGGAKELRHEGFVRTELEQRLRRQFIAAVQLKESGVHIINDQPDYLFDQELRIGPLVRLVHRGELPKVPIGPYDIAAARLGLQLRASPRTRSTVVGGASATRPAGVRFADEPGGCVSATFKATEFTVHSDARSSFSVESPDDMRLDLWVPIENGVLAGPRWEFLEPNRATVITTTLPAVTIWLPAGTARFCGIAWA